MASRIISVFSAQLGFTADTCDASFYEAFGVRCRVVVNVISYGAYGFVWDCVKPMRGNTSSISSSTLAFGVRCRVVVNVSLLIVLRLCLGLRKAYEGKYIINYIQYLGVWSALSCGGECFTPYGAYDCALDSVMPMKGNTP